MGKKQPENAVQAACIVVSKENKGRFYQSPISINLRKDYFEYGSVYIKS